MRRPRTRAFVRGAAVSLAAITMTLTVSVIPAVAATTVTSFTPPSGSPGTSVSVTGSGFTAGTGVSSVTFHGVATTYNVADDQHLHRHRSDRRDNQNKSRDRVGRDRDEHY